MYANSCKKTQTDSEQNTEGKPPLSTEKRVHTEFPIFSTEVDREQNWALAFRWMEDKWQNVTSVL